MNLGLEPRTLQFLICEAHQRLKGCQPPTADRQPLTAPPLNPDPQPLTPDIETAKAAKTAKAEPGGDMTEIGSEISDRVPSPETQSVESVDVRSGTGPDTGILESSIPGPLGGKETAKSAKSGPDSDTGPLESSTPGVL